MQKAFFRSLLLLIFLNLLIKPLWIFGIDRQVQNITGFTEYGKYFALLNLTMVCNFLLDLGITSYFNQHISSGKKQGEGFFSKVVITKLILCILYGGVIFFIGKLSGITDWRLLVLLALLQILTSFLMLSRAYLTATQHFQRDAVISVTDRLIVILAAGALIILPGSNGAITIQKFVIIQVCAVAAALAIALLLSIKDFVRVKPHLGGISTQILLPSLPFAINIFFMTLMTRGDSFLLERLHPQGATEAGIYASAFRLLDALNMVGFLFAGFLLPYFARHQKDVQNIHSTLLSCRYLLLLYALMAAGFIGSVPGFVNTLLYHHTNVYNERVLWLTMLSLPALSLVHIYGTALTATGNIRSFVLVSLVFACINFFANLFFAGKYGAIACAIIACCTQIMFAVTVIYVSHKKTQLPIRPGSLVECLATALAFWMILKAGDFLGWNIPVVTLIAGILIVMILFITGRISFNQILKPVTEN